MKLRVGRKRKLDAFSDVMILMLITMSPSPYGMLDHSAELLSQEKKTVLRSSRVDGILMKMI